MSNSVKVVAFVVAVAVALVIGVGFTFYGDNNTVEVASATVENGVTTSFEETVAFDQTVENALNTEEATVTNTILDAPLDVGIVVEDVN